MVASGTGSDALRMAGDPEGASRLAARGTARIAERWGEWSLGGIWLAALGIAAEADLAAASRLRRDDAGADEHAAKAARWERVAQETAVRGRPRGGALGPEGRAWLLRCTAEAQRAAGATDVPLWESVVDAFDYGYPYEVAKPEELFRLYHSKGFQLMEMTTTTGLGCNELVFRRTAAG